MDKINTVVAFALLMGVFGVSNSATAFVHDHKAGVMPIPTAQHIYNRSFINLPFGAKKLPSALDTVKRDPNLSIMVEAIEASGLSGAISMAGDDYLILAPNNAAFSALFKETNLTKQKLMNNKSLLRGLLAYHVVKKSDGGKLKSGSMTTYNKRRLVVTPQYKIVDTRGRAANVVSSNIKTKNGTLYVIDRVLVPKK